MLPVAPKPAALARGAAATQKRQRILEAASELFFEKGYAASTLDMLAARLDVTKPYIYTYFRNKSDLLAAICETGIAESLAAMEMALAQETGATAQLKGAVAGVAAVVIRFQTYVAVYQREMKSLGRRDAQRILQRRHHFDQQMAALLARGVAAGEFYVTDAGMTSVWIGGLLSWISIWYMPGGRRDEGEVIASLTTAVLRIVQAK